jgi:hypothetical protein
LYANGRASISRARRMVAIRYLPLFARCDVSPGPVSIHS